MDRGVFRLNLITLLGIGDAITRSLGLLGSSWWLSPALEHILGEYLFLSRLFLNQLWLS